MSEHASPDITIPAARYTDRSFARLEQRHIWRKAWLLIGSVDHVAEPGDYLEVRHGAVSILVVRGDDGRLRGFENVCQHQAGVLCTGTGSGLTEIKCPQHQWTWDLSGRLQSIDFGEPIGPEDNIPLLPVHVETWGPFVFASLDVGAEPLADAIAPLVAAVEGGGGPGLDPASLRCRAVVSLPTGGNWKSLLDCVTGAGPVPDLGVPVFPNLAVRSTPDGLTVVRARPVSTDRATLDVLTFDRRAAGPPAGPRPFALTLGPDDALPADVAIDPEVVAFARRQSTAALPTEDLLVDPDSTPRMSALHTWLEGRLGIEPGETKPGVGVGTG